MSSPLPSPDLAFSPLPNSGYLSPAESDAIQTPFLAESDHDLHFKPVALEGHGIRRENHIQIASPQPEKLLHDSLKSYPRIQIPHSPKPPSFTFDSPVDDYEPSPPLTEPFSSKSRPRSPFLRDDLDGTFPARYMLDACHYSQHFPAGHTLCTHFASAYQLEDELGSGGYGFVMTAKNRAMGFEVAVKFIIKEKVPDYAWVEDERYGRLPTEVFLLDYMDHDNIVKGLDLFQDHLFFYLVQELHGSPWPKAIRKKRTKRRLSTSESSPISPPSLTPSVSADSFDDSTPVTPPIPSSSHVHLPLPPFTDLPQKHKPEPSAHLTAVRPQFSRRPSHDLFECIEQSVHKRLPEEQARYVFRQVVDAVHYLDSHGIAHRDIKDENIAIDKDLNVKLIDFGSSIYVDPTKPRPYYTLFYGTTAYAASEILMKKPYKAAPAEVWTLGVLLSYLLHGMSPFPTAKDAMKGRIVLEERPRVSRHAYDLMRWCLDPNPLTRATIRDIQTHRWLDC